MTFAAGSGQAWNCRNFQNDNDWFVRQFVRSFVQTQTSLVKTTRGLTSRSVQEHYNIRGIRISSHRPSYVRYEFTHRYFFLSQTHFNTIYTNLLRHVYCSTYIVYNDYNRVQIFTIIIINNTILFDNKQLKIDGTFLDLLMGHKNTYFIVVFLVN